MRTDRVIYVASSQWLLDKVNYEELWQYYRGLNVSRRELLEKLTTEVLEYPGAIELPDGRPWPRPYCITCVFNPDNRWYSYYLLNNIYGTPLYRCTYVERLRIMDLWLQILETE